MRLASNYPTSLAGKPVDYEAVKRRAYLDQGIAIIDLSDRRIPWQDREIIEGACKRIYGKKA